MISRWVKLAGDEDEWEAEARVPVGVDIMLGGRDEDDAVKKRTTS
jgi:hypothetical protein